MIFAVDNAKDDTFKNKNLIFLSPPQDTFTRLDDTLPAR
jgi:hypothetical protein